MFRRLLDAMAVASLAVITAAPSHAASTLVHNVNGYTCDERGRLLRFSSLRIDGAGKIEAIDTTSAPSVPQPSDRIVDGGGRTLLPGLIDAHGHVRALGEARRRVDLVGTRSLQEALGRIREYADAHPDQRWIEGRGWNQELWPGGRFPTATDLDGVVADRPVVLGRVDGHASWVNSRALAIAEITSAQDAPVGGRVEVDSQGRPTGVLVDAAMGLVDRLVPPPARADDKAAILVALGELASLGVTGVHDAGITPRDLIIYRELAEEGALPIRVYAMLAENARFALKTPLIGLGGDRLSVQSVKVYADGALGSRGAALLGDYADASGNRGLPFKSDASLATLVADISARGFQVNVHAIGDAANRMVLDAFASLPQAQRESLRHRIEHAQIIHPEDIPRFANLGVLASMQPTHATSDMFMAMKRLDPSRLIGAYAWRSLLDSGASIPAGSDFPVEPANPFFGLHAAITRRNREGAPGAGWYVEEAMTRTEALCAFTVAGAYAAHADDRQGRLAPGYWADFILVDRDPFEVEGQSIWEVEVLATWVSGDPVYDVRAR